VHDIDLTATVGRIQFVWCSLRRIVVVAYIREIEFFHIIIMGVCVCVCVDVDGHPFLCDAKARAWQLSIVKL
jgi:hypothetical protein